MPGPGGHEPGRADERAALLLHPASGLRRRDLDRHHAARLVRDSTCCRSRAIRRSRRRRCASRRTFPGASSEDAAQAVAAPIEEQLAGLQGMLYYASSNASDGSSTINVTFDVDAQPGSRRRRRAERREARRAAAAGRGAHERHHDSQSEHRHPRRGRAPVERSALRRDVSGELHEAVSSSTS